MRKPEPGRCPSGQVGELIVRGPQVMKGYWKNEKETLDALRDGWLYTGDLATMDSSGYFFIVDRKKDLVISGGYNIYPREIEEVLYEHPKVLDAAAIGVPHPRRGEAVKVFIVLKEGETLDRQEILDWCSGEARSLQDPQRSRISGFAAQDHRGQSAPAGVA